jgi:hypothetical protein
MQSEKGHKFMTRFGKLQSDTQIHWDTLPFCEECGQSWKPAFEQQENTIQLFILRRHYNDAAITKYSQNKFLPQVTQASFCYYGNMLSIIPQLAFDHPNFWYQGPAKAMLDFHLWLYLAIPVQSWVSVGSNVGQSRLFELATKFVK